MSCVCLKSAKIWGKQVIGTNSTLTTENCVMKKTLDDDDATTADHADAADGALQSAQQTAIDIRKCCTASGAALTKQTSEMRHTRLSTNQQSTSKSTGCSKQGHWQLPVT